MSDFNGRGHIPFLQETQILQLIDYLAHPDQHYAMITGVTAIREPQYNITLYLELFGFCPQYQNKIRNDSMQPA